MSMLKLVGVLMDYPQDELWAHGEELQDAVADCGLPSSRQRALQGFVTDLLGSDPLVLAVHRSHPLAVHDHVPLSALSGHCLLMREPGSTTRQLTEQMLQGAGVKFGPLLEIGSRESIREAVLRNIGISIIARQEVPHDPQLRVLTLENAPQIPEYLYCLKERKAARLPAAFLGLAQEMGGC